MKVKPDPSNKDYFMVYNEGDVDAKYLMGWKGQKGSLWMRVEDNLVNRIVLGLPALAPNQLQQLKLSHMPLLKEYQMIDVAKICERTNSLNANPMGLGKTLETIMFCMQNDYRDDVLIVCPHGVAHQWAKEFKHWWPEVSDNIDVFPKKIVRGRIIILNYEKVHKYFMQLKSFRWKVIVVDEAHRIKNPGAVRTKDIKNLPAGRRLALTGTPILNKPNDLWSILNWLDWKYAGKSVYSFEHYFCEMEETEHGFNNKGLTEDPAKQAILNKLIDIIGVRNSLSVAAGKTVEVIPLEMGPKQRKLYYDAKNLAFESLPDTLTIANGAVLVMRCRQITSNPKLFDPKAGNVKFDWIKEFMADHPEEKIVVFSAFRETALALQKELGNVATSYHGKMNGEEKEASKMKFIEDPNTRVLIGTIGSLGTGVDGLQHASRIGIFIDREWSPEIQRQAEGRLERLGQDQAVLIYYLDCIATVDKHVGRINLKKSEDVRAALGDDN